MSTFTLSSDQRHLLGLQDLWMLLDALLGEDGAKRLISRQGGACGFDAPEGAPDWMISYQMRGKVIHSPMSGPAQVTVSAAQILRFGATLSDSVRAQMLDCVRQHRLEQRRVMHWCRCPYATRPPNAHSGPCTRHHPSDTEDAEHRALIRAIAHRATALRDDVLALDAGQLALFP